jgi:hypothetical protein
MRASLVRVLLCVGLLLTARAHSVWVEPDGQGGLRVRFAEPDGKFEKSPGHLDSLTPPAAFALVASEPVSIDAPKQSDRFDLRGASATNVLGVETSFTVRAKRKPLFYARWQPAGAGPATPVLTLDLVPTGTPGEVRVWFRGQPLGNAKLKLRTPDEKETDVVADANGVVRFESKQSGLHLLTLAHHRENLAGVHMGRPYEQTSHNAALTWQQP